MQIKRREGYVEVVFGSESFDLNEADIAPRSDEVRNDEDGGLLRRHGQFVFVFDFRHALIVRPT
jgi:hypothetical protein